LIGGAF